MHELAVMQYLVEAVQDSVPSGRIRALHLQIGDASGCEAGPLVFCFEVATLGTRLEGAVLEVEHVAGETVRVTELEVC
jgi:Zn finger protein HypA/HybF involved in hydrogenase expression